MNARTKARVAKLRRVPDEIFAEEARRRGFARLHVNGPITVQHTMLAEISAQLDGAIIHMARRSEGHASNALHTMGSVLNKVGSVLATHELAAEAVEREATR